MAKPMFEMKSPDMDKLKKFFKKAPHLLKPVSANVLNSLAFKTREYDIKNISNNMVIRNERFLKSSLRVTMASKSKDIDQQKSFVYSITKPRFSGWEEQQKGTPIKRKRSITKHARGGSRSAKVKNKYKVRKSNKFYKPEQYQGKSYEQRFQFMMRVLGSRGGGVFLLSKNVKTKRGQLGRGVYELKKGKIIKVQDFNEIPQIKRYEWRTKSLNDLMNKNDIAEIWRTSLSAVIKRRGLKKS